MFNMLKGSTVIMEIGCPLGWQRIFHRFHMSFIMSEICLQNTHRELGVSHTFPCWNKEQVNVKIVFLF